MCQHAGPFKLLGPVCYEVRAYCTRRAHALKIHAARLLPTAANRTVWEQINAVTRACGGSQASMYFFGHVPFFFLISAVTGQRIDGIGMDTVFGFLHNIEGK